ncbi:MAG: oxaloacetate decarboxylase [Saprospiraceae bacterium]|nr:oxaloacetate decarboxylase [Saprospiraceae bacterium]
METNLFNALSLLLVGMFTVFIILFIVVTGGQILIKLVNRLDLPIPGMELVKAKKSQITPENIAAITATVEIITDGKGKVAQIRKIE